MGVACSSLQEVRMQAPAPELREPAGPAGLGQGGASSTEEAPAAPPPPPPTPGTAWQAGERKALALLDGLSEAKDIMVIVSFPGVHEEEWNNLVGTAKLMQALGSHRSWLSTACIFLPENDPQLGLHSDDIVTNNGACFCKKLYGSPKPWGCRWFSIWLQKVHLALERGQKPWVVYKAGQVGEGDTNTWEDFPIPFSTDRRGLGGSQAGEVAYLKYYLGLLGLGDYFYKVDVRELVNKMMDKAYANMQDLVQGDEGAKRLATALTNTSEVQKGLANLSVSNCRIKEAGGYALARALPACSALKRIDLDGNSLGDAAGQAIARALPACAALETIHLHATGLGEAAGLELARALASLPALKGIDLSYNSLGDAAGQAIARALPACAALETIDLRFAGLGEAAGLDLARALASLPALKGINLDCNSLGDAAGQAIARALPACAALEQIDLRAAGLGEAAGLELARALASLPALERINLHDNSLGDAAGQAIARALPACAALEIIDLRATGLGEAAGLELARALASVPALRRMGLGGNGLMEAASCLSCGRGRARAGRALREAAAARGVVLGL